MVSYRMWVPQRQGRSVLHFNDSEITPQSVVQVAATEATDLGPPVFVGQNWGVLIGAASITVENVCVRDGGVDFVVNVDWSSPLNVSTDITILDPPAQYIVGS
ncbi:hypothetical protein ABZW30_17505 [Kitasatospora sp. NPDC004669]|uniref:hypothetical protein n=1 Tax=Kitasatospora sp. NPDC004669 TaxID=3154555 RepID=UPI0033BE4891